MNDHPPNLSERFTEAMAFAHDLHCRDVRKGTSIPYFSHLMSVSALVLEYGGSEDQAIAGLLHDAAEDHGGQRMLDDIRTRFGDTVADIVAACSDSLVEDRADKLPWWQRRVAYIDRLETEDEEPLLVSAADKLHNARCTLADYRNNGDKLFDRFNKDAGRVGSLWYYSRLSNIFSDRFGDSTPAGHLAAEVERTVAAICDHALSLGHDVGDDLRQGRQEEEQTRNTLYR